MQDAPAMPPPATWKDPTGPPSRHGAVLGDRAPSDLLALTSKRPAVVITRRVRIGVATGETTGDLRALTSSSATGSMS